MAKGVKKLLKEILKAENKMLKMLELGYIARDIPLKERHGIAYVDGSYNEQRKVGGYGVVMIFKDCRRTYNGVPDFLPADSISSIACELASVYVAVKAAQKEHLKKIIIKYDCAAIVDALERPKNNPSELVLWYRQAIKKAKKKIKVKFKKVKAHSGNTNNNQADTLARQVLKAELAKMEQLARAAKRRAAKKRQKQKAAARKKWKESFLLSLPLSLPCKALVVRKDTLPMIS